MSASGGESRSVGPVHRAFALLQLVVAADGPIGVRELARRSGLATSTTGRMLGILTELGMVERTAAGEAQPGAGLAVLTESADRSLAVLRERYRPLATRLMREFGENAAIAIDDGDRLLYVASASISSAVQVPDPEGERFDFHVVAPGLMAMAAWPRDRLEKFLAGPLRAATRWSVTDPTVIRQRLERVCADGFVWTDQELDLEVNGVAAPLPTEPDLPAVVATLYGPAYRLNAVECPGLGRELVESVGRDRATGVR